MVRRAGLLLRWPSLPIPQLRKVKTNVKVLIMYKQE